MEKITILFIIFLNTNIFAQKTIPTQIIFKNNDTLQTNLRIPFNPGLNKIYIVDENGKNNTLKKDEIKLLKYIYFNEKKITFRDDGKGLNQILFDGKKLKWYRITNLNLYDGSVMNTEYIENKNNDVVKIGVYKKSKNELKLITENKQEISTLIDENKITEEFILEILQKYDE
jgi:hypothetical protein